MKKYIISIVKPTAVVFLSVLMNFISFMPIDAITGSSFESGRIIDNHIFENKNTMSVSQIQKFLTDKNSGCTNPTCLYNYYEDPNNTSRNNYDGGSIPSGAKSAAQHIYNAAQEADINPQVLLVTLQKETSLITHRYPGFWRFERAMGYGCFDTSGCQSTYAGFSKQVRLAALQYRRYLTYPNNYNYPPGDRNIRFHPVDIGKSQNNPNTWTCKGPNPVRVLNTATAGLYAYTPYQPNQAALNSYPGTGDSCSSYGNRNFWFQFNNWFGSTVGAGYSFIGGKTGSGILYKGEKRSVSLIIKNKTDTTWYSDEALPTGENPTRLATLGFIDTPFADTSDEAWLGKNQIKMKEDSVAPGENATFEFNFIGAPSETISYETMFRPIVSGVREFPFIGMRFNTTTPHPLFDFELQEMNSPVPKVLMPGSTWKTVIKLKNTGGLIWKGENKSNPVRLSNKGYITSPFAANSHPLSSWLGTRHTVRMEESEVRPGETATFNIVFYSPYNEHYIDHNFILVMTGMTELTDKTIKLSTSSPAPNINYKFISADRPRNPVIESSVNRVSVFLENTGNVIWRSDNNVVDAGESFRLAMHSPAGRISKFYTDSDPRWLDGKAIVMKNTYVRPGEVAEFEAAWTTPSSSGNYLEPFILNFKNNNLAEKGLIFRFTVP